MVNMDDLRSDGFVMLQKRLDPWWNLFWCFVAPALVAKHGWGERFLNAFMVAGALRYLCVLHFTWLVNSAAHLWGCSTLPSSVARRCSPLPLTVHLH